MEYKAEFILDPGRELSSEELEELTDDYLDVFDSEGSSVGSVKPYTRLDYFLACLWIFLWRIKWFRKPLEEKNGYDS